MLKHVVKITLLFIFLQTGTELKGQVCWLVKDSVSQGTDSSAFVVYNYNAGRLSTIEYTDSGSQTIETTDSILYGSNGKQSVLRAYDAGLVSVFRTTTLSYNANDQVSRIHVLEDDGFGANTIAHDLSYNASGEIISIKVDPSSIMGTPDVFDLNFENMVWQSGNLKTLDLIGDLIGLGIDTVEFTVEYDTMPNIGRFLPIEEVGSLIEQISGNNIRKLITLNDEVFGSAGTLALDRIYTYTSFGEVATVSEKTALFSEDEFTTAYAYQCSGIGLNESKVSTLDIYPLPAFEQLTIHSDEIINTISVYNMSGQLILKQDVRNTEHVLFIDQLKSGVYILEIEEDKEVHHKQFIVK